MRDREDLYLISDLSQIKALADPLRQQILAAFVSEPRTTKQVAILLEQPLTKLYHHVDLLEKVGLIELVETKQKRGTVEKYFRAIANRFAVAGSSLGAEAASVIEESFAQAFAAAQSEIRKAVERGSISGEQGEDRVCMALGSLWLSPVGLEDLRERILDLAKGTGGKGRSGKREFYRYLMAVYPATDPSESEP